MTTLSVALTNTVDFPFGANYNVITDYVLKTILNGIPLTSLVIFDDELSNMEYIAFSSLRLVTLILKGITVGVF